MPLTIFIRWVLSHLTFFVVLFSAVYIYLNRAELWSDEVSKTPHRVISKAQTVNKKQADSSELIKKTSKLESADKNQAKNEKSYLKYGNIVIQEREQLLYPGDVEDKEPALTMQKFDTVQTNKPKAGSIQNKNLQKQMRARQKQLQNQMVSLIPVSKEKSENHNKPSDKEKSELISVKPIIESSK